MSNVQRPVWLVGADDFARDIYGWLNLEEQYPFHRFAGFLYDGERPEEWERLKVEGDVGVPWQEFQPEKGAALLMGLRDPGQKAAVAALLRARGGKFEGYMHPTAIFSYRGKWFRDETYLIGPFANLAVHVTMGDLVYVGPGCYVGTQAEVGAYCTLRAGVTLAPAATLGEAVEAEPGAVFGFGATVGSRCWIGPGSVVLGELPGGARVWHA